MPLRWPILLVPGGAPVSRFVIMRVLLALGGNAMTNSDGRARPEDQIEGFADGAFADVVGADNERVAIEFQLRALDTAEVHDLQVDNFQLDLIRLVNLLITGRTKHLYQLSDMPKRS